MKHRVLKRTLFIITAVLLVLIIAIAALFWNELRSLSTLKQLDDYGMFQMTYYGDYGFDSFLETGAKSDSDIEAFVTRRLLKGLPIDLGVTGDGCTAFAVRNERGEMLYGRNFDFAYAPSLQVFTAPDNGYASVSTVNLSFAGYDEAHLPHGISIDSFLTLAAPFLPFDGMNEKGVAMALLAVPEADGGNDPKKVTLNTTTAIRLVLDKAATAKEAVALLEQYNIYFSADVDCHFLIADASGASLLVEYYDGAMRVTEADADYQIASNFIAYNGLNIGEGSSEFDRYDTAEAAILGGNGVLTETDAISLLEELGCYGDDGTDKLQWSVLYNLTTMEAQLFAHRNTHNIVNSVLSVAK